MSEFLGVDDVARRLGCSRKCAIGVMQDANAVTMFSPDPNLWRLDTQRFAAWVSSDLSPRLLRTPVARGDELVYFIEVNGGPIKIGYTTDVTKRIEHIRMLCPYEVRLRGLMLGSKRLESALHGRFQSLHLRGEWFKQEGEIATLLARAPE